MARKPPVQLALRLAPTTRRIITHSDRNLKMAPAELIGEVMDLYEMLMVNSRVGICIGAISPDQTTQAPNLLMVGLTKVRRRYPVSIRTPRTLRARCQRLAKWSGTDDVGGVIEKAITIYAQCMTMNETGWTFYCRPRGHPPVPFQLFG